MTYGQKFIDLWNETGGLISQAEAARLFELSRARINQFIKENKLNRYEIEGKKFLSYTKVYEIYKRRVKEEEKK
jgi:predicted XRE-type DNA-binding protein